MKFYLEFKDEKSDKFWSAEVRDNNLTVTYGKVGSAGKSSLKSFSSIAEALKEARKQAKSKIKKGYIDKTLQHSGKTDKHKEQPDNRPEDIPADATDDGQVKPWHLASYWDTWGMNMDMSPEELRHPDRKKVINHPLTHAGNEMPEEVVKQIEYQLINYGREKKVEKVVEGINKLHIGNVNAGLMQRVLDQTLWSTQTAERVVRKVVEIIKSGKQVSV